ncbi:MAG: isoprenylcysteine carboxylmethyltransferase family protein [Verrucomicrobia bacterium]|nr:isoprenylcysteine carboxylmethyltransferase family protein [Verrucomicrobiota bacterium]
MLYWLTTVLAFGYFALELFLLTARRGKDSVKSADRGTLIAVWGLISGGCFAGFLLARRVTVLNWPERSWILCLADILLVCGIALPLWAVLYLGKYFTVDVGIQPGHQVIQDGPYRFVRHPSYTGAIIALAGIGCLTFNWLGLVLILVCTSLAYALRIPVEERALLAQFGSEYEKYAARTKRVIPWIY